MQIDVQPDFMADVNDLLMYVTGLSQDHVFRGNQSREVLPKEGDFAVFTPISQKRIGTNVSVLHGAKVPDSENAPETDTKLLQVDMQIDFWGADSFRYVQGLENFCHSLRCLTYLKEQKKDIRVLYASNPVDATLVDDTRQYIPRWTLMISICFAVSVTDEIPWIEDVAVVPNPRADLPPPGPDDPPYTEPDGNKLINVDVEYKGVI
jgi:hypothetical protein